MRWMIWLAGLPLLAADGDALRAYLEKATSEQQVAGAVVVVQKNGRTVFQHAAGYADLAAQRKIRVDDLFMMASSTKPFSAATILTLVDQGKLSLDDPVKKHYPEFAGEATVRQLLSHTSGIFGNNGPAQALKLIRTLDMTLRDSAAAIVRVPLSYPAGSQYSYGGASFEVAGGIAEKLSGTEFPAYMRRVLLEPLGMKETFFHSAEDLSARIPVTYSPKDGKLQPVQTIFDTPTRRGPRASGFVLVAGGLYSTAADCLKLLQLHVNNGMWQGKRVLSEAMVREMRKKQTGALAQGYGLGWNLHPEGVVGHGGAYGTDLWFHPERGLTVAVMIQQSGGAQGFQKQVRALVLSSW